MPVPDTNTFSLQDVVDVVNPTTDDLVDCFADAISGDFDGSYSGNKDELNDFRNYGAVSWSAFYVTSKQTSAFAVCTLSATSQVYHDGTGYLPAVGDHVAGTSSGNKSLAAGYYGIRLTSGQVDDYIVVTGNSGYVSQKSSCMN